MKPDFAAYYREELLSALHALDREAYPESHALLLAEIAKRKAAPQPEGRGPVARTWRVDWRKLQNDGSRLAGTTRSGFHLNWAGLAFLMAVAPDAKDA